MDYYGLFNFCSLCCSKIAAVMDGRQLRGMSLGTSPSSSQQLRSSMVAASNSAAAAAAAAAVVGDGTGPRPGQIRRTGRHNSMSRISRPPPLNPGGGQGGPPPPPPTSRSLYRHNSANSMQVTTVAPAGGGGGGGGGGQQHLTVSQMQHRSGDKLNPQTLASCEKSSTMSSITAHNSPI